MGGPQKAAWRFVPRTRTITRLGQAPHTLALLAASWAVAEVQLTHLLAPAMAAHGFI